jgi:chromosome segregation protein
MSRASLELAEAEKEIEEGRGELVHRISKIAALKNFLEGVMAQSEKVATEILKLKEEYRELETERQRLDEQNKELEGELSRRKSETERLAGERETLEIGLEGLSTEFGQIESHLARRREELSELTGRLASLEELVDARAHFGAGARHLLTAGDSLDISLAGSVADSIEVDSRFERATERFLGDWLQRIVVDNEQDALAAQAHLEEQNVGRCDFLVESLVNGGLVSKTRESLEKLQENGIGGIVGLLSDRVRWTNGKGELLGRVLPDAIIVESVETAIQAFRSAPHTSYVTLTGDVIEPPGVLRVGPGGPSEGLLSTRREIRELRQTSSSTTEELESLGERRKQIESEIESRRARLAAVLEEQHDLDKAMVGLEHQSRQLEEEASRARRKAEVLGSEQSRAESERISLSDKRVEMEQSLVTEEEAKSLIESKLDELRSSLGERRTRVENLQSKAAEEASQVAALRERAQAVRFDVERLREGVQELEHRMGAARRETQELADKDERLKRELANATAETNELFRKRDAAREQHSVLDERVSRLRLRGEATEGALRHRRRELEVVRESRSSEEVALAREESEMNHLRTSFVNAHSISIDEAAAVTSPTDLARDDESLTAELEDLRGKLDSIGPVNPMADEEYRELETRHEFLTTQRQDLLDSISSTETAIRRIDTTSRRRFQEAFHEINRYFDITFKQLFGGGRAGLSLTDDEDILESGIDINAQPPGKRLQNVLLLSGGEKALTAIALMFAVFRYKPSPFCLLDEVDAPLDDANVGRFISMLGDLRKSTQFIIITHNRKTMEIADQMYGVTMEEPGISKLVSVKLVSDEAVASEARPS